MTLLILIGVIAVAVSTVVLLMRNPLVDKVNASSKLARKLRTTGWFRNHWKVGLFLFGVNAGLFLLTGFLLYLLVYLLIPVIHLFIMFAAVAVSILFWIAVRVSWQGTWVNRMKASALGSSFYLVLALGFVYKLVTLQPPYPGDDTCMGSAIGLVFGAIVAVTACIVCFLITGFATERKIEI